MQTLNCLLALGGDRATTVPKYGITPAEVVLLQRIHGDDAVFDVEPTAEIETSTAALREDLRARFPARKDDEAALFDRVFPDHRSVPQTVADLGLHEEHFKVLSRVTAAPVPKADPAANPFDDAPDPAKKKAA